MAEIFIKKRKIAINSVKNPNFDKPSSLYFKLVERELNGDAMSGDEWGHTCQALCVLLCAGFSEMSNTGFARCFFQCLCLL